jgi:hypothetical protein
MTENSEPAAALKPVVACVAILGLLLVLGSVVWMPAAVVGVSVGAVFALLHLLAVAFWVGRALGGAGFSVVWVVVSMLKLLVVLAGLAWLAHRGFVPVLPFLAGYGALPLGVMLAGPLFAGWGSKGNKLAKLSRPRAG